MRFLIRAMAVLGVATSSGCGVSEPAETSGLEQAVVQTCAVTADCSTFAADQCLPTQIGACFAPGTASAHCVCVTPPRPSIPVFPPPMPGATCWEIRNDCVSACELAGGDCRDQCDWEWGHCGF